MAGSIAAALLLTACGNGSFERPAVTRGAQAKWPAGGSHSHFIPSVSAHAAYISYFDKPNTPFASMPKTMDTGQPITYSFVDGRGQSFIINGGLTIPGGGSGPAAGYAVLDGGPGNYLDHIGIRFRFDGTNRSTVQTVVALAMTNEPGVNSADPHYRMAAHFTLSYTTWTLQKVSNETGTVVFTTIATGPLKTPLNRDNTVYTVELWQQGTTCYVSLPDGQLVSGSDPDIAAWVGRWGFYENYMALPTDVQPYITEAWYDADLTGAAKPAAVAAVAPPSPRMVAARGPKSVGMSGNIFTAM